MATANIGADGLEEYTLALERRLKTLETIARVGAIITSRLALTDLTQAVVEHLGQVLRSDRVNVVLYDKKEQTLNFIASFFSGEDKRGGVEIYPLSDGMNSWIVKNQKPLLMRRDTISECERMGIRHGGKPAKSWLGVPMFHNGEVLGVLSVQAYEEPGLYDESSVELLSIVAAQVAVAVVNAELYETMEKREKEKQRLYYSLTHDLLSFVSPIDGYAEILRMAKADDIAARKDDIAKSIKTGVKRISRFVEDILFYSKLEAGKLTIRVSPADIYGIIAQSASNFFSELGVRRLAIYVDGKKIEVGGAEQFNLASVGGTRPAARVVCDQIHIERVLNNCIHNAVKHARTRIDVGVARRDGEIICTVSDDGDGMPEELAPKVFDEYFQGHSGKKGVGLGLPSVKRIVEQHGGRVWVETAKGSGFSFSFTLPAA